MKKAELTEPDVLLELQRIGNTVRVAAIDPVSNTEVVIQGPVDYGEESLKRAALAKLNYVLRKKSIAPAVGNHGQSLKPGGNGLLV